MKITVTQTNKQLANNEYLICIRVYSNGKYKHFSTSVSCTVSNWNSKSNTVSSKDRNYKEKNAAIQAKLEEVTKLYSNTSTEEVIEATKSVELTFYDVINMKIEDCNTFSYKKNFIQLSNYLKQLYPSLPISSINQVWFNDFIENLQKEKETAQQNKLVKMFNIVYGFGLEKGVISKYIKFKYTKKKTASKERYLTASELNTILTMYHDTQEYYYYLAELELKHKAVYLFILHLAFQGIAPIDMCRIRIKDLIFEDIETEERNLLVDRLDYEERKPETIQILNVKLFRQKTNEYVNIITYTDVIKEVLEYFTANKTENDYLIDCLDARKSYTDKQIDSRVSNYYSKLNKVLNEYYKEVCERNNLQCKHITYYMARHSFINKLYQMGVQENVIKRLVGHKDSTLQRHYIADVQKIEQANIIKMIFQDFEYVKKYPY